MFRKCKFVDNILKESERTLMELKIIKIDGEFTIVELKNGEKRICPTDIFPTSIKTGDCIITLKKRRNTEQANA